MKISLNDGSDLRWVPLCIFFTYHVEWKNQKRFTLRGSSRAAASWGHLHSNA